MQLLKKKCLQNSLTAKFDTTQKKRRKAAALSKFILNAIRCKLSLAGRTENALDLVHIELLELVAGGAEILSGIEFGGL